MTTNKLAGRKAVLLLTACAVAGVISARCSVAPTGSPKGEGTLRLLVTDKPFPLDLIEEANITVTRVEVRLDDGTAGCLVDADCADDVFCNGVETCAEGDCVNGDFPCQEGEFCDEETQACMSPCTEDGQCDDALFCNGAETCDLTSGECQEGEYPCLDQECDEAAGTCVDELEVDDDEEGNETWVTIFEGQKQLNLLDLQNGRTDLLADTTLQAGTYTQTRLVVTEGTIKLKDVAEPFSLRVPSGEQTGIKLHFTFEVVEGEETVLLLDVDLSNAFRPIPGGAIADPSMIRTFHFTPSVAMKLIDVIEAGSLTGVVTDDLGGPLAGVMVTAFDADGQEITSSGTEAAGEFTLIGLLAGTYRLEFSLLGYEDAELTGLEVLAGETTVVGPVGLTPVP